MGIKFSKAKLTFSGNNSVITLSDAKQAEATLKCVSFIWSKCDVIILSHIALLFSIKDIAYSLLI